VHRDSAHFANSSLAAEKADASPGCTEITAVMPSEVETKATRVARDCCSPQKPTAGATGRQLYTLDRAQARLAEAAGLAASLI
jgi:hypothetical protein